MKKAVFFDIDGTIWDEQMQIPKSAAEAIRALRANGHYAFLCSGRSRANIHSDELEGIGFDGIVASCGAHIEFHGKKVYEYLIPAERVQHTLEVLRRYDMPVLLEGPEYAYVRKSDFQDDFYVVYLRENLGDYIKDIDETDDYVVNKMSVGTDDKDISELRQELAGYYDFIDHNIKLFELVPKGCSKAVGIKKVCELLDVAWENTYAFGDSANDFEMIAYVAHGIAMGNGIQELKDMAEYVTTSVREDGIKKGLLHYALIKES